MSKSAQDKLPPQRQNQKHYHWHQLHQRFGFTWSQFSNQRQSQAALGTSPRHAELHALAAQRLVHAIEHKARQFHAARPAPFEPPQGSSTTSASAFSASNSPLSTCSPIRKVDSPASVISTFCSI